MLTVKSPAGQSTTLIDRPRTKLMIAAAAALVLLAGSFLRPRAVSHGAPAEAIAPILEEQVQSREPARAFRRVPEAGRLVPAYVVAFLAAPHRERYRASADFGGDLPRPPEFRGFGVGVSADGEVLTHRSVLDGHGRADAVIDGQPATVSMVAYDPATGLALVRSSRALTAVPNMVVRSPEPGELVLAAGDGGPRRLMPRFLECVDCGGYVVSGPPLLPGTPVFTLEGEALGIAGAAGQPVTAIASALERLRVLLASGRAFPSTLGMVLQEPDEPLTTRLGPGLIVAGLAPGGPAEKSGLRAGDVLLSLGGEALVGLDAAHVRIAALPARQRQEVQFRRGGQVQTVALEPDPTMADPRTPWASAPPPDAPTAAAFFAHQQLVEAGVALQTRLLSVEGQPVTGSGLSRDVRRHGPPWLVHLHDGTRPFFAMVGTKAQP